MDRFSIRGLLGAVMGVIFCAFTGVARAQQASFIIKHDRAAITSLVIAGDQAGTDYIQAGKRFGDWFIQARTTTSASTAPATDWVHIDTADLAQSRNLGFGQQPGVGPLQAQTTADVGEGKLSLLWGFENQGDALLWSIHLKNIGQREIEIGDLGFPLATNNTSKSDGPLRYDQRVMRHSFVAGDGSFIFWTKWTGTGPLVLMVPQRGTALEYFVDNYQGFVHSLAQQAVIDAHHGRWPHAHTSRRLAPGESAEYGFRLLKAKDYDDVRQLLVRNGLIDVEVAPGMTVPQDQPLRLALRSDVDIQQITAQFPRQTHITQISKDGSTRIYEVQFSRLGENTLTVHYGKNQSMWLDFFLTEPVHTLLQKRAAFIVDRQQIRDSQKWYDGLFSDWSMKKQWLLTPDNIRDIPEGRRYMVTCDDPGLSRPAFLALKNSEMPDPSEVAALDYYIAHFVWGGLQMTESEPYPYAIYGIQDWKRNRDSDNPGAYGRAHIWRCYDYPHIIVMYLGMYRTARYHPSIHTSMTADQYLQRAYGTAVAFFTVPKEVIDWSAYQTGYYNEVMIEDLIHELDAAGWHDKAFRLRRQWEKKVNLFVSGKARLLQSEYAFDTTGFESTEALAAYAMTHLDRPKQKDLPLDVTRQQTVDFMQRQMRMNVAARGWLEKQYYWYGSDYRRQNSRYTLSYMSAMGGWGILDYALHFDEDPQRLLKLGYGSILSSWALMNTGTPQSDYGYWFPGKINDGGAGGGFEPAAYGTTWLGQPHDRGCWAYGCEIDLGFCGYLRAARSVLTKDPTFGLIALGGTISHSGDSTSVVPHDGVRRRFDVIRDQQRFHMSLSFDRFAADKPIVVNDALSSLAFVLESCDPRPHQAVMTLGGLPAGNYQVLTDGKVSKSFEAARDVVTVTLPVNAPTQSLRLQKQ